ncbi:MAG: nicotinate-nucleotide adenylyltransferase [Vicinamibacterales bacterium]
MTPVARLGVLGGTFDPIHVGHVAAASAARHVLALDRVLLMPTHVPPHRAMQPQASPFHRFAMAALAAQADPAFAASDLELQAPGPTFTSTTLARLAACGYSPLQIFFITGADAFADIDTWRDYPALLEHGHFVVISRPGCPAAGLRKTLPALAPRMVDAGTAVPSVPSILLVDTSTPDVSSTAIRRRASEGAGLDRLVPPAVAAHIHRYRLYSGRSVA